jgi:hypothetical protein
MLPKPIAHRLLAGEVTSPMLKHPFRCRFTKDKAKLYFSQTIIADEVSGVSLLFADIVSNL